MVRKCIISFLLLITCHVINSEEIRLSHRQNILFTIGYEGATKMPFYLCKVSYQGGVQPGKTWQGYNNCNVPFAGKELLFNAFRMIKRPRHGYWIRYKFQIPDNAYQVGYEANGRPLYLCKAPFDGGIHPGKTWRGYDGCNIPYGGKEVIIRSKYWLFAR